MSISLSWGKEGFMLFPQRCRHPFRVDATAETIWLGKVHTYTIVRSKDGEESPPRNRQKGKPRVGQAKAWKSAIMATTTTSPVLIDASFDPVYRTAPVHGSIMSLYLFWLFSSLSILSLGSLPSLGSCPRPARTALFQSSFSPCSPHARPCWILQKTSRRTVFSLLSPSQIKLGTLVYSPTHHSEASSTGALFSKPPRPTI
ncbi:hypothetical protein LZ30DRAFT_739513 [Colletotrichum cereale]|nr:hypothetical protein LZ30DRAFT_739513 [Colletotrichum cereale]